MQESFTKLRSQHYYSGLRSIPKSLFCAILMMVFAFEGLAQTTTVTGTVKDYESGTLPGVNVVEKGTTNGTITDINGQYTIAVPEGATLVFS